MRGPSLADCENSYARTGIPREEYVRKDSAITAPEPLVIPELSLAVAR